MLVPADRIDDLEELAWDKAGCEVQSGCGYRLALSLGRLGIGTNRGYIMDEIPEEFRNAHDRHLRYGRHIRRRAPAGRGPGHHRHDDRAGPGHSDVPEEHGSFVHDLPESSLANVDGDSNYVRVQVLTNAGALDRDKQLAVVRQLTGIIAAAARDPGLAERTWVLLTEAPEGGWGLNGHANTNAELVNLARAQIAELNASQPAAGA